MDADLKLAADLGILLLPNAPPNVVRLDGRVLRFDPSMPADQRADRVRELLTDLPREAAAI